MKRAVRIRYQTAEQFLKHNPLLRKGMLFLPAKASLPVKTRLSVNISFQGIDQVFEVDAVVIKTVDQHTGAQRKIPSGMLVAITGDLDSILQKLHLALSANEQYSNISGLNEFPLEGRNKGLTLDWLKEAISQKEAAKEEKAEPEITGPPTSEKKDLTLAEREKVKPAGDFLMDLTKAMLRSGYYSSDHPGSKKAKQGLYKAFKKCLGDNSEITITNQETREMTDVLITGILDEPINVRALVGAGMAELFVPKLKEYFNRKALVSFAIKNRISPQHFEKFVDIMSDPRVDQGENSRVGELLSNSLVENGITEISAVFKDDIIALELNLPWRVELAIQRLAKDLKVLPMFKGESPENIRKMKLQIVQDIIRPIRHPEFLKDLILNCKIVAKHAKAVEIDDIETVIIEAFPLDALLPTAHAIFAELGRLREMNAEHPDNQMLKQRFSGVKRILSRLANQLLTADVHGKQKLLEQLYFNDILAFEELPHDVQYLVNTIKMVGDVQANIRHYVHRILHADSAEVAFIMLKCFRRVMPGLLEHDDWQTASLVTRAVEKAAEKLVLLSGDANLPPNPLKFIFEDLTDEMVAAYEKAEEPRRKIIEEILRILGSEGVTVLGKVLAQSDDSHTRKAALDSMITSGDLARHWVLKVLDDPEQTWYMQRNALYILRHIGRGEDDIARTRKFIAHSHPKMRDEALNTMLTLKADDAEQLVIAALNDSDDKVRWRAMTALNELAPFSEASIIKLLDMIKSELSKEKEETAGQTRKVAQLVSAVGTMPDIPNPEHVEDTILQIAKKMYQQKKGLFQRLKMPSDTGQSAILSAAIATLGKIGTPKSETFLNKLAKRKSPQAEIAQKAAENIRLRHEEQPVQP